VAHTYTRAWDTQTGLKLVRRPRNKTTLQVIGQVTPEWQISGNILYVGRQVDLDDQNWPRRINMPSYSILGAETSYQLNDQWQIYGRGENVLNHRYENPNGYQQPGLGVYMGIRAKC
jgi:vitamin B12 transporter